MPERYTPRSERRENFESFSGVLGSIREYKEKDPSAVFIVGVNGARSDGNTANAMDRVLKRAESHGCRTIVVNLRETQMTDVDDAYSEDPASARYPVSTNDDIPEMHELLLLADGIVFATSTNWGKETPRMSLFTNHLTPLENSGYLLEGKTCISLVSAEESGQIGILGNQLWTTNNMGMSTPPYGTIYIISGRPNAERKKARSIQPKWAREDLDLAADNMIKKILSDRFSGIDWDRRRSAEQIRRLQDLLRAVSFERGKLVFRLTQPYLQNGETSP